MNIKTEHLIIGGIILAVLMGWITIPGAVRQPPTQPTGVLPGQEQACLAGCYGATDSDLQIRTQNYVNSTQITEVVAHSLFSNNDAQAKASSTITAYPHSYATLPTCFSGYLMTGEDNGSSPDYYFVKTPVSWGCDGTPILDGVIKVVPESSVTFTSYDDGTSESTWNVSVGTSKVTSAELKIESSSGECIGNPSISRPIGICINGTAAVLSHFNDIKPTGVSETFPTPGFLTGQTTVKDCYVLPTEALCDGTFYRFYITIDPISNPTQDTDNVYFTLVTKNWYLNDDQFYEIGWEDKSDLVSDAAIGITGQVKILYMV